MNRKQEHDYVLALSTFPEEEMARKVARELIENAFVACANIIPSVQSIYFWQGKVEEGAEVLALFKMTAARFDDFVKKLRELHPYELPEIVRLNIDGGLPEYLRWINESCGRK
ncbi:MAG: divalent-cation tolerance protein CutA [Verrucomicrobia bacterium]|nr:divalent-cation tolerance protein CutA [Verrucomicrobiota bacterium]